MTRYAALWTFGILLASAGPAWAQRPQQPGPWDGDLWLLESADGLGFGPGRKILPGVGVPTLIADRSGRLVALFQWFPEDRPDAFDRVAVSFSGDLGRTWSEPEPIRVEEFPEELMRPFDPTIVELEDGRIRLYFTSRVDKPGARPAIHSAISQDAVTWRYEPGVRFAVDREIVIDCAVARLGSRWHLYSPVQEADGRGYHAVSEDGLAFERRPDVALPIRGGSWLGCAVTLEGALRFYGSGTDRGGWSAISADGEDWELEETPPRSRCADPGVARTRDGRWVMIGTHAERRADREGEGRGRAGSPMAQDEDHVYVLDGQVLTKFDKRTLAVAGRLDLSEGGARSAAAASGNDFEPPLGAAEGPGKTGPWNTRLMLATSPDGLVFTRRRAIVTDQGDVPDLVMDSSGRLLLYYTGWTVGDEENETVVAISTDGGEVWTFRRLVLSGFERMADPCDPEIQVLEDGRFRLFLTSDAHDGDGPRTYVADSEDGIEFRNLGVAFARAGREVLDPSALRVGDVWHLYNGGRTRNPRANWFSTSADGRTFRFVEEREFLDPDGDRCAVSNGLAVDGGYRFYVFSGRPETRIRSFFSTDGDEWRLEDGVRLAPDPSSPLESGGVKDSSVARLPDGSYLMVYVTGIPGSR